MDRRKFGKNMIAMLGLAGTANVQWAYGNSMITSCSPQKLKVTLGAHPWVYAATQPNYDITPVLDKIFVDISYAGLSGVELMHHPLRKSDAVQSIKELSDEHKLPVIGTSYGANMWDKARHNEILEDAELIITNLASVGGRTLGTSVGRAQDVKTEAQLDAQAELLKKLIKIADDNGVVLNLHNHTYEVENDMHDLKGTLKRIPDAKLGPDINWLIRGGADPVEFILEYGEQIVFLHLRDQHDNGKWSEAIGEGDTDFNAIGDALRKINFQGDGIIELAHEPPDHKTTRPLRDSLVMSKKHLKKAMKI